MSADDDLYRAINEAAAAVQRASLAAAWAAQGPHQSAAITEATEYAMAGIKGIRHALTLGEGEVAGS